MSARTRATSLLLLLAASAHAATGRSLVAGQTYAIAEPDAMAEIRARAASIDPQRWLKPRLADYAAFQSATLPRATRSDSHLFDPTYLLPQDLRDETGKLLYPKGTPVNVYTRIRVPGRYIVIGPGPEDYAWLRDVARPQGVDKVLLAGGNALLYRQHTGAKVFALDARFIERFGLRAVPSIVQQEGQQLRVAEYLVATTPAPKAERTP